ncbi:isoamylase early set domain-containing protein [Oleidesulfovibrio sp.]|uniref:isoamylase early set domain-containing protein n=1 Tax=Oleidesulfovibrio sp. TaxID=2909707 RepID=UPI003A8AD227
MSLNKQFLKSKPVCKVKFRLDKSTAPGIESVYLVGDFNDWNENSTPMKRLKDGSFSAELTLETGRQYHFRYLADGSAWLNDDGADAYSWCEFAQADNSVVEV